MEFRADGSTRENFFFGLQVPAVTMHTSIRQIHMVFTIVSFLPSSSYLQRWNIYQAR
jgi:hypothetical protein